MNTKHKRIAIISIVGALLASSNSAFAQSQDEVNKQIAKLIGEAISARVATSIEAKGPGKKAQNSVYGSYSFIDTEFSGTNSDTDLYLLGYDRDITSKIVIGAALNHSRTDLNQNASDFKSTGIDPYLTYLFNENIFAIFRIGYSVGDGAGIDINTKSIAASLNGVHKLNDNIYSQWRLEVSDSETEIKAFGFTTKSSALNYLGDVELGYRASNGFKAFIGTNVSISNSSDSYSADVKAGIEKELSRDAAIQLKYSRSFDDNISGANLKQQTFTIAARLRF